jgi:UDP-2-acetamido-2,6-beta-L-arabino-hexul-4-ose reductase
VAKESKSDAFSEYKGRNALKTLVTGAKGFVGKNLCTALKWLDDVELYEYDIDNTPEELADWLQKAQVIVHLAGVNRPQSPDEYQTGNTGLTEDICRLLIQNACAPKILLSSSIQVDMNNPYGDSKRGAEEALRHYCEDTGAEVVVYRFKNLYGKLCRPNYNSVTATFCCNIAHGLPVQISDPAREIDLTYIDDVVETIISEIKASEQPGFRFADPLPSHNISLGELAAKIQSFRDSRSTLLLPDFGDEFTKRLYSTYLSYLEENDFSYQLDVKSDDRGCLAEFVKSPGFGQIFVSRTNPGVTRGNHFHHTKTEKFMVVEGKGIIRFRKINSDQVLEYSVSGEQFIVVDIPPGYTHSIENVGDTEMVTLFWACEMFDPDRPETYFEKVIKSKDSDQ